MKIKSVTIKINTTNAAFADGFECEVAGILRNLARKLEDDATPEQLYDANGNPVGSVKYSDREVVLN